jgi:8-amino-7-oxononanoate synthase
VADALLESESPGTLSFEEDLAAALESKKQQHRYRSLKGSDPSLISFCDNDYLGLADDPRVREFAASYETAGRSSRLVSGNHLLYAQLEVQLAAMKQSEATLVFSSGFAMNISLIPALTTGQDLILADKLCHASLIDGIRHSEAVYRRFPHNDMAALEQLLIRQREKARHCFIVTETIFSMDGGAAPVEELVALCERYNCQLIIDDAHGIGLLPPMPKSSHIIHLGTLSKAVGSLGGYVCASKTVIDYLINHCRSLIYSTALPPMVLAASLKALELMQAEPERAEKVKSHVKYFCEAFDIPMPPAAIVPFIVKEENRALALSESLRKKGFQVAAIRPPTVPPNASRLRFSFSSRHSQSDIDALIKALKQALKDG